MLTAPTKITSSSGYLRCRKKKDEQKISFANNETQENHSQYPSTIEISYLPSKTSKEPAISVAMSNYANPITDRCKLTTDYTL